VLMPVFAWLAGLALGLSSDHLYVAVILACLPTAQNVYNYAATYQKGLTVTRDTVFLTTFASLPVMAVVAGIFGS
jgi:ABC transport system, permease protein